MRKLGEKASPRGWLGCFIMPPTTEPGSWEAMGGAVRAGGERRRRGASTGHAVLLGSAGDGGRRRSCSVNTEISFLLGRARGFLQQLPLAVTPVPDALIPSLGRTRAGHPPSPPPQASGPGQALPNPNHPPHSTPSHLLTPNILLGAAEVQLQSQNKPSAMDEPAQLLCTRTSTGGDFGNVRVPQGAAAPQAVLPGGCSAPAHSSGVRRELGLAEHIQICAMLSTTGAQRERNIRKPLGKHKVRLPKNIIF